MPSQFQEFIIDQLRDTIDSLNAEIESQQQRIQQQQEQLNLAPRQVRSPESQGGSQVDPEEEAEFHKADTVSGLRLYSVLRGVLVSA